MLMRQHRVRQLALVPEVPSQKPDQVHEVTMLELGRLLCQDYAS